MGDLGDGLALLRRLSQRWPALPVLVLSAHCNASTVTTSMRAGARGFLSKSTAPDVMLHAIDVVARGGCFHAGAGAGDVDPTRPRSAWPGAQRGQHQ
ncbi:hypothetical protein G6F24_016542 [Rhizopus arrhizus]|nr:hypothetical protein G6F24_016542 [Rhizopus arrhizus]